MNNIATINKPARMSTNPNELGKTLSYLNGDDLTHILVKSKVLSLEECYDVLMIDPKDLPELDAKAAKLMWKKGRAEGIAAAGDKLFSAMGTRQGAPVAMDYMSQLSETFSLDAVPVGSGFSFNVNLKDD